MAPFYRRLGEKLDQFLNVRLNLDVYALAGLKSLCLLRFLEPYYNFDVLCSTVGT